MGVWGLKRATKLNLAIVGCGDIAGYTAWIARLNLGIRLSACCDIDPTRAEEFGKRHKIQSVYDKYDQMLSNGGFDAVYLAVPHHLHYSMIAQAIEAGIPIFVEKPITRTLEQGIEITQRASNAKIKLAVNYQYRYDAGCYALARAVQHGDLGQIHYARINVPWQRDRSYFEGSRWHRSWQQSGGGTLITQGSHMLDIVLWALGSQPIYATGQTAQRVYQDVEVEDLAMGTVEMGDGVLVQISTAMIANPEQAIRVEVYGHKGTAIYQDKPFPRVRFQGVRVRTKRPPHGGVHALQRSLEGFRAWVTDQQPYLTPAAQALPVMAVVEALYHSAQSGKVEPVQLSGIEGVSRP